MKKPASDRFVMWSAITVSHRKIAFCSILKRWKPSHSMKAYSNLWGFMKGAIFLLKLTETIWKNSGKKVEVHVDLNFAVQQNRKGEFKTKVRYSEKLNFKCSYLNLKWSYRIFKSFVSIEGYFRQVSSCICCKILIGKSVEIIPSKIHKTEQTASNSSYTTINFMFSF